MVFTVVTILFVSHQRSQLNNALDADKRYQLPLSFLSSMFALDVASFLQAPSWVFAVMCTLLARLECSSDARF